MTAVLYKKSDNKCISTIAQLPNVNLIIPTKYAALIGVSKQMVSKYIKNKKIVKGCIDGLINPSVASQELLANLDPSQLRGTTLVNIEEQCGGGDGEGVNTDGGAAEDQTFSARKLYRLNLTIKTEEREAEIARGEVIYKKPTEVAYAEKVGNVIRRLQKIPKMVAPALAKETGVFECEGIVMNAIKKAVTEF